MSQHFKHFAVFSLDMQMKTAHCSRDLAAQDHVIASQAESDLKYIRKTKTSVFVFPAHLLNTYLFQGILNHNTGALGHWGTSPADQLFQEHNNFWIKVNVYQYI